MTQVAAFLITDGFLEQLHNIFNVQVEVIFKDKDDLRQSIVDVLTTKVGLKNRRFDRYYLEKYDTLAIIDKSIYTLKEDIGSIYERQFSKDNPLLPNIKNIKIERANVNLERDVIHELIVHLKKEKSDRVIRFIQELSDLKSWGSSVIEKEMEWADESEKISSVVKRVGKYIDASEKRESALRQWSKELEQVVFLKRGLENLNFNEYVAWKIDIYKALFDSLVTLRKCHLDLNEIAVYLSEFKNVLQNAQVVTSSFGSLRIGSSINSKHEHELNELKKLLEEKEKVWASQEAMLKKQLEDAQQNVHMLGKEKENLQLENKQKSMDADQLKKEVKYIKDSMNNFTALYRDSQETIKKLEGLLSCTHDNKLPVRDYESLQKKYEEAEQLNQTLKSEISQLRGSDPIVVYCGQNLSELMLEKEYEKIKDIYMIFKRRDGQYLGIVYTPVKTEFVYLTDAQETSTLLLVRIDSLIPSYDDDCCWVGGTIERRINLSKTNVELLLNYT